MLYLYTISYKSIVEIHEMSEKIFQEKWIDIFALNNFAFKSLGSELGRDTMWKALSFIYHNENVKKEKVTREKAKAFIKFYDTCVYKTGKDISYYISDNETGKSLDLDNSVKINITVKQAEEYLTKAATEDLRAGRKEEEEEKRAEPYLVSWKFLRDHMKEAIPDIKVYQNDTERALKWWKYFKKQSLKPSTGSNFELPLVPPVPQRKDILRKKFKRAPRELFRRRRATRALGETDSGAAGTVSVDVKTSIQNHALKPIVLTRVELLRATESSSIKSPSEKWKNEEIYLSYLTLKEKQTKKTIDWFKNVTLQPYKSKQGKRQKLTIISNIQAAFHYKWLEFAREEIKKWYTREDVDNVFKATLEEEEEKTQDYFTDKKINEAWKHT